MAQTTIDSFDKKRKFGDFQPMQPPRSQYGGTMDNLAELMAQLTCETLDGRFQEAIGLIQAQSQQINQLLQEVRELKTDIKDMKDKGRFMVYMPPGSPSDQDGYIPSYIG